MPRKPSSKHFAPKKRIREYRDRRKTRNAAELEKSDENVELGHEMLSPASDVERSGPESCGSPDILTGSLSRISRSSIGTASDSSVVLQDDQYCSTPSSSSNPPTRVLLRSSSTDNEVPMLEAESKTLLLEVRQTVSVCLPANWISIVSGDTINVLCLSRKKEKAIQRQLGFSVHGEVTVSIHGKPVDLKQFTQDLQLPGALHERNVNSCADFILTVVSRVRLLEVCAGADHTEYEEAWSTFPDSYIDKDFFKEVKYDKTLRVNSCTMLVEGRIWRCAECNKASERLRRKTISMKKEANPNTANVHLTDEQKVIKIRKLSNLNKAKAKQIDRLQNKMASLIKDEGMSVDNNFSDVLQSAFDKNDISKHQALFLQQQLKAAGCKNSKGMRWHPHLIRFALSVFMSSPSTYNIIVESGLIRLPHSRTLFDYSHVYEAEEGISAPVVESVSEEIKKAEQAFEAREPQINEDKKVAGERFKWCVLLCDEMHISKNIVYHERSGNIVGYTKLAPLEKAMEELKNFLDNVDCAEPTMASKMLSFMVKGVCTKLKEVVASYSVDNLNKEKMYAFTWDVICTLERSGIQVICVTSDGNAVNRAFFKMNTPITKTDTGVVFDTVNKAAPWRPLYFMSDLPHLIKTLRNNFYNSRVGKKSKRCLTKNGQKILWSTIIRLYNDKKDKILRKSYKLNACNVFPDSYSCMKVVYAFQVLSRTVSNDIEAQGWPNTSETVKFIRLVNDMADCMNVSHSKAGIRKANPLLDPYRSPSDPRFTDHLEGFLDYLSEWKREVMDGNEINESAGAVGDESFHSLHDIHEAAQTDEQNTPASKKILCYQTLEGAEIAIKGFMGAVKYLLSKGDVDFVNARVFCQDYLEQFFSKQRAKGGSSTAPNLQKFLNNARDIHLQKGFSVKKRKGNTEVDSSLDEICDIKLTKRRKTDFDLPRL